MPMMPGSKRRLGKSVLETTQLGFGAAALGELFAKVTAADADATLSAAWDEGIRYFDTAPFYGKGLSERRVGDFLRAKPPSDYVLSTKVGRILRRPPDSTRVDRGIWTGGLEFDHYFDYTYAGILRTYDDSLQRLGLPRVDMLVVHDLDFRHHAAPERVAAYLEQLATSGWRALDELRSAGEIRAIGVGINELGMIGRFLDLFDPDFFLVAMRYTLLDQESLVDELPRCSARDISIVVGAVFNSGILATGLVPGAKYDYGDPPTWVVERVRRIEEVCQRHDVPLVAAALQFPLALRSVASVIPGGFSPDHVRRNAQSLKVPIPNDLWAELQAEGLLRLEAPVPHLDRQAIS